MVDFDLTNDYKHDEQWGTKLYTAKPPVPRRDYHPILKTNEDYRSQSNENVYSQRAQSVSKKHGRILNALKMSQEFDYKDLAAWPKVETTKLLTSSLKTS